MKHFLLPASLWLSVMVAAGCSGTPSAISPTGPTTASVSTVPTPGSNQTTSVRMIRGFVTDTAMRPLDGARVEVLDGVSTGTSAVVDSNGAVVLSGFFDTNTRFRVTKDGHETLTQTWNCSVPNCQNNAQPWLGFYVRPLAPPVDLAGDYTLTITAASTCSALPVDSRSRSYPVTLTARTREGTADVVGFNGQLHSNEVPEFFRRFGVGVAGDYASIILRTGHGDEPGLVEYLESDRSVRFIGSAAGTVSRASTSRITFAFDGSIEHGFGQTIASSQCDSRDHQLVLARR